MDYLLGKAQLPNEDDLLRSGMLKGGQARWRSCEDCLWTHNSSTVSQQLVHRSSVFRAQQRQLMQDIYSQSSDCSRGTTNTNGEA